MRARSRIIRNLVVTAKRHGKSYRVVAREFDLPIGTVKRWCSTYGTLACEENGPQHGTLPAGVWMQSIYHDSAHFITAGHAACENAQNGVHALGGVVWFPHDGNLRKCFRCMSRSKGRQEPIHGATEMKP